MNKTRVTSIPKTALLKRRIQRHFVSTKHPDINVFNLKNKKLMQKRKEWEASNREFMDSLSQSISGLKYGDSLNELKSEYERKGIKVPNLSPSHNLFELTPLIMTPKHINHYYGSITTQGYLSAKNIQVMNKSMDIVNKSKFYLNKAKLELEKVQYQKKNQKGYIGYNKFAKESQRTPSDILFANKLKKYYERKLIDKRKDTKELMKYNRSIEKIIPKNIVLTSPRETNINKFYHYAAKFNMTSRLTDLSRNSSKQSITETKYSERKSPVVIKRNSVIVERRREECMNSIIRKDSITKKDLSDISKIENVAVLDKAKLKRIFNKYCEKNKKKDEKEYFKTFLDSGDPNELAKLIIKFKKDCNSYDVFSEIPDKRAIKDKRKVKNVNKLTNVLSKTLIQRIIQVEEID